MNKTRVLLFASVIAAAMIFGGVMGATVFARSTLSAVNAAVSATSPNPTSNENTSHEQGESAAQETAENNGTAHRGGHPCGGPGHSNEASTHETGESTAVEAQENAACPSPAATTTGG